MPFYDYECDKCKKTFEIVRGMNDDSDYLCPKCSNKLVRIYSPPIVKSSEPKTVGAYMEKIADKKGGIKEKEIVPGLTKSKYKKIINMNPEQVSKYISGD